MEGLITSIQGRNIQLNLELFTELSTLNVQRSGLVRYESTAEQWLLKFAFHSVRVVLNAG